MSGFGRDLGKEWAKEHLMSMMPPINIREGRMKQHVPPSFEDTEAGFFDTEGDVEMDAVDGSPAEKHVDADFFNKFDDDFDDLDIA